MPLQINGATSGSTVIQATDAVTATLTLPSSTGTLLSTANPQSGGVIQVVQATTTTPASTSSTTFVTTGFSATITPKFSTSKILVIVSGQGRNSSGTVGASYFTVYRNAVNLGSADGMTLVSESTGALWGTVAIAYLDSPATTSATTYTLYFRADSGGTAYSGWNVNSTGQQIILQEVAA